MNTTNPAPATSSRDTLVGLAYATLGAIAFSGKAIIVKLSYRYGVDAVTVIMYRMLFALPLFLALSWWAGRNKPRLTARGWRALFVLGVCGYYLASFLDFAGLRYISASLVRLILYLSPTIVLLLGVVFSKRKVSAKQWLALGVSCCGVLLVFAHDLSFSGDNVALGSLLVFGSTISYAFYLYASGEEIKRLGPTRITGVATSIACVLCIAQFFILRSPAEMHVAPEVLWLGALNATACTFAPVLLVMMGIARVGSGLVAQAGMIGPFSTIVLSVIILNEPLTVWMAAGTVLVLAGIGILTRLK